VTISNDGLSMTFNVAWGAVLIGMSNSHVGGGLNIINHHDVGRELQTDQFMYQDINGAEQFVLNPTQAGAGGYQAYYQHPNGSVFQEVGSPVVSWSASGNQFNAVITPLDFNTGSSTDWVYVENVRINSAGVAAFHYTSYDYQPGTYRVNTEIPTLYSDYTNEFMYSAAEGTVKTVTGSPTWPQPPIASNGWIASVDANTSLGIFYTTPKGLSEMYGTFPVSGAGPLGKTNVVQYDINANPGTILSSTFSVALATVQNGPALIASQSPASFTVSTSLVTNGAFTANAAAYVESNGYSGEGVNPSAPIGWTSSGGNTGINGIGTGFYGSAYGKTFAPVSSAGVGNFSFLQRNGAFISQNVTTAAGKSYTLAFDAAARSGDPTAVLKVQITDGSNGSEIIALSPSLTDTSFTPLFLNFTAGSTVTNIRFLNVSPPGDLTVDVANVSLAIAAVPEPFSGGDHGTWRPCHRAGTKTKNAVASSTAAMTAGCPKF
jgi:hypothetical protein